MGGITAGVRIEDREVRSLFRRLIKRGANRKPVMEEIGELLRTSVVKNFEEGGRPDKWKPLSPATLRRKKNKRRILIEEAILLGSIKSKAFSDRAEVGTNKVYAAIHQFGGKTGRNKSVEIPARPYLVIQDEDWTEIKESILDYILKGEA